MMMPNDWAIKRCLWVSLAVLLANVGLIRLADSGYDIPVLTQIVGFIFVALIPGVLILRILKIHNIGAIESLLYSVGLSLGFVMFAGLFANFALPLIGVSKPIAASPLLATLAIFTLILGAVAYLRDRDSSAGPKRLNIREILSPPYLLLFSLPLLAIVGADLVNRYQNNWLLLAFIVVVAGVVAVGAFNRLPRKAYPLAIALIGLSLLLHISLISSQLVGGDIYLEYYFQDQVLQNGLWDSTIPHNYNTALSVVLLCPIFSLMLDMDSVWVFKIIYPLIFCLVPVALFHIFRQQIGDRKAFFSAFFFMSMMTFANRMPTLARQEIAELFFALLILLLIDRRLALGPRLVLAILFAISLVVSHYALGYIVVAFLLGGWGIVAAIRSPAGRKIWGWLSHRPSSLPQTTTFQRAFPHTMMAVVIGVYLVVALGWYGGIAQGTALDRITEIGQTQYSLLSSEPSELVTPTEPIRSNGPSEPGESNGPSEPSSAFLDPKEREGLVETALGLDFASASPLGKSFRIFQYLTQFFIVLGFLIVVLRPRGLRLRGEHVALSVVAALILFACIVLPRFSGYLNVHRFYHVTLFLLAPLCVIGGQAIWQSAFATVKFVCSRLRLTKVPALTPNPRAESSTYLTLFALAILTPYFLFNAGFFFELTGSQQFAANDSPSSVALSSHRLDMAVFSQEDAEAVCYLQQVMDESATVYGDRWGKIILYSQLWGQVGMVPDSGKVPEVAYVFLRTWNVDKQEILVMVRHGVQEEFRHIKLNEMPALLEGRRLIYDKGGTQVWSPR